MGKKSTTKITESLRDLYALRPKQTTLNNSKRLESLILFKSDQFSTLKDLVKHLQINPSTLDSWLSIYRGKGIDVLLKQKTRTKNSKFITLAIHKALKERLKDLNRSFNDFWDAQQWIKDTYQGGGSLSIIMALYDPQTRC